MNPEGIDPQKVDLAINHLEGKWSVKVLIAIINKEEITFSEIKRETKGISNKMLSDTLKDLREADIIRKSQDKYGVTARGEKLVPVLVNLEEWAENHLGCPMKKVMLIEGDRDRASMYENWLGSEYDVIKAYSRSEAVENIDDSVDVVVLDLDLQDSSLTSLAENIMSLCGAEVIALTSDPPEKIRDFDPLEIFQKPIEKEELKEAVSKAFE